MCLQEYSMFWLCRFLKYISWLQQSIVSRTTIDCTNEKCKFWWRKICSCNFRLVPLNILLRLVLGFYLRPRLNLEVDLEGLDSLRLNFRSWFLLDPTCSFMIIHLSILHVLSSWHINCLHESNPLFIINQRTIWCLLNWNTQQHH